MTDKKFNAILAKNEIARELREWMNLSREEKASFGVGTIIFNLKEVERYLGESNQPSIIEIIEEDTLSI